MLESKLEDMDIIWNVLPSDFDTYVKTKPESKFKQFIGSYAHCRGCAKAINKGKVRYVFYSKDHSTIVDSIDVENKFDLGEPVSVVIEVDNGTIKGYIKEYTRQSYSNQEKTMANTVLSNIYHRDPKLLKEDIYRRLRTDYGKHGRQLSKVLKSKYKMRRT